MNETTEKPLDGIIDPVKAEQQLNLIRYKRAFARRNFLKNVGLAGAGIAAGAVIQGCSDNSKSNPSAQTIPETDVLNFALNLEYLEAEFYSVAVTGATLDSSVTGGTSTATGGAQVTFTDQRIADIAAEILNDEMLHVKFLRTALGAMAVAEPAINLDALGIGFASQAEFLTLSRAFEDTGVSAYAGAATLLTGNNLQAAAQILATEAYHAGNIRLNVVQQGITVPALDAQDVPPDETHFFPVDANALAIKRTTSQVLAIVYANATAGTSSGGFFPSGVNGNIKTV
ncbi:MAG: ferritin-like domain-containing protein [Acidobacteriota bacterium]|nr:ferritin-like domain-containing protein [Acidobacteriota bacterium]